MRIESIQRINQRQYDIQSKGLDYWEEERWAENIDSDTNQRVFAACVDVVLIRRNSPCVAYGTWIQHANVELLPSFPITLAHRAIADPKDNHSYCKPCSAVRCLLLTMHTRIPQPICFTERPTRAANESMLLWHYRFAIAAQPNTSTTRADSTQDNDVQGRRRCLQCQELSFHRA